MNIFNSIIAVSSGAFDNIFTPIMDIVSQVLPWLIALVAALGSVWCIVLGVKLAKAEEQQERDKAKNALKNAIIGFVLIFVLLATLELATPALQSWMSDVVK